jgi:hypothetical protein
MSELSKQALKVENNTSFPNNNGGLITPQILRDFNTDMIDSLVDEIGYTADSASWNQQINALEVFTASFTGSTTNTGSLLLTASFDNNTRNLTFTKGDATTFNVNIPDVSGSTGNFATTGSNTFIGDQTISGSLFVSGSEVLRGTLSASALRVENNTYLDGTLTVTNDTLINGDVTIQSATPNLKLRDTSGGGFSSGYDVRVDTGSFEIYDDTHNRDVLSDVFNPSTSKHTTSLTSEIIVISGSTSVTLIGNVSASIISASTINGLGDPLVFSTSVDSRLDTLETATSSLFTSASLGLTTASLSGQTLTFSKGDGTTFGILIPDVSGSTINTGSFATTGSNVFTGDQTLTDASGNFVTLSDASGSLMLVAKGFTSASAHISASSAGIGNIIFKTNSNTADTIVSGSGNIFTNAAAETAGFKRYIGGSNNIVNSTNLPQLSGSMQFSPTFSSNYIANAAFTMRGPVSSSTWTISNNNVLGTVALGSTAANHAQGIVAGLTMASNNINGALSVTANRTNTTLQTAISFNQLVAGTTTLNMNSSSIQLQGNIVGGLNTINNNTTGSARVSAQGNGIAVAQNIIIGGTTITASGSNDPNDTSDNDYNANLYRNLILGNSNAVQLQGGLTGSNSLSSTSILGNNLIVTGSSPSPQFNSTLPGIYGSAFVGRFNAVDGNKALSAQTIFAVGTGTSTSARKTGFLIDSGSNTFIEGTLNVSGATSLNGDLNITGSLTASLQQGFVYVGNASGITTTVSTSSFGTTINTGSFATTGSNAFFGTNTFSGAVSFTGSAPSILSSSFSGSLITNLTDIYTDVSPVQQIVTLTSASYAALVIAGTLNPNTLYVVSGSTSTINTGSFATTGSNNFVGSQTFTGSVYGNVVSMSISANTASMDLSLGNYFELTSSATPVHISVTNLRGGLSTTLIVSASASSSILFSPNVAQPSGSAYSGSLGSVDVLSFVGFNSSKINVVATKALI